MADDKRNLLHSLAIDRAAPPPAPRARWPFVVVGGRGGRGLAWFATSQMTGKETPPPRHGRGSRRGAGAATAAAAPRRTGALVASGYIVARRKATVAAEVTGKVIEVNVEEGKVVTVGQVLARLDSVLAESDLNLAKSRRSSAEAAADSVAADLRDAELIWNRTQSLSRRDFASTADLTKAEARVGVLRAQFAKAKADAETARLDVQRYAERARQAQHPRARSAASSSTRARSPAR